MINIIDVQERARLFNEDEAVWWRYEQKRAIRRLLGPSPVVPEETRDAIDWREAEREIRQTRCIGK